MFILEPHKPAVETSMFRASERTPPLHSLANIIISYRRQQSGVGEIVRAFLQAVHPRKEVRMFLAEPSLQTEHGVPSNPQTPDNRRAY